MCDTAFADVSYVAKDVRLVFWLTSINRLSRKVDLHMFVLRKFVRGKILFRPPTPADCFCHFFYHVEAQLLALSRLLAPAASTLP